jgi:hypothetical protein
MELNDRIKFCPSLAELAQLLQQHRGQLDKYHATAALSCALKLSSGRQGGPGRAQGGGSTAEAGAALAMAAELFDQHLGRMNGRALSNAFHGLVSGGHEPANGLLGRVLAALLANGGAKLRDDSAQGTSNVLWALATLHREREERFEEASIAALVGVARGKLRASNPQNLSNTAWALAVLGHEDRTFMGELLAAAQALLQKEQAQGATEPQQRFAPQALSNTLWAAATLGLPLRPGFLGAFLAAAGAQLQAFKPQELSITAWALAKLSLRMGSGSNSLGELLGQPPSAQPGWPKAQLQRFLDALADEAARRLAPGTPSAAGWKAQELSATILAFSDLRHFHAGLWAAITGEAQARCGRGEDSGWDGQAVSNLALGLAKLRVGRGGAPDPALGQLLQQLGSRLAVEGPRAFSTQAVCNLAWSHAAVGVPFSAWLMEGLVLPLASNPKSLAPENTSQLLQYLLAMERPGSGMPPAVAQRPEYQSLRQLCVEAHQGQVQERSREAPSQLQLGVHAAAQRLAARGMLGSVGLKQLTPSGLFSVDVAVMLPGGRCMAVEVDGPTRFSSNCDAAGRPMAVGGASLLRDRLLPAVEASWAVASVPYHEWDALRGDAGAEERCLLRLLGLEGGGPPATAASSPPGPGAVGRVPKR